MWIGLDWLGIPAPSRDVQGIGRFARRLRDTLVLAASGDHVLTYLRDDPGAGPCPGGPRSIKVDLGDRTVARSARQRLVDENPDGLDWFVVLDPIGGRGAGPPPSPGLSPLKLAAFLPEWPSADDVVEARRLQLGRQLATLARYDLILTPSEAIAEQVRRGLGVARERIVVVGPLCDRSAFLAGPEWTLDLATRDYLAGRGIHAAYILHQIVDASATAGVIDAYSLLPATVRSTWPLVLTGEPDPLAEASDLAFDLGVSNSVVLLSGVDPAGQARLVKHCGVYLSASRRDGLHQGLYEALCASVPILAVDSPGRRELLGDSPALLPDPRPGELAAAISALLDDPARRARIRQEWRIRARVLDESSTGIGLLESFRSTQHRSELARAVQSSGLRPRPRVAYFHAPANQPDDTALGRILQNSLIPLLDQFNVEVYLDPFDRSGPANIPGALGCFDRREFGRRDSVVRCDAVVHEIGEASDIDEVLGRIRSRPGVVLVRDPAWLPPASFVRRPGRAGQADWYDPKAGSLWVDRIVSCVLDSGSSLVVESRWAFDRVSPYAESRPDRVEILPWSFEPVAGQGDREALRSRWGIGAAELLVLHCGPAEGEPGETLRAQVIGRSDTSPGGVPADLPGESIRSLEVRGRSIWLELVTAADLAIHPGQDPVRPDHGLSLRDLLRGGLCVVVPDAGLPEGVVVRVAAPVSVGDLSEVVLALATDPARRQMVGAKARLYAVSELEPGVVRARLAARIEARILAGSDSQGGRRRWRESRAHDLRAPSLSAPKDESSRGRAPRPDSVSPSPGNQR